MRWRPWLKGILFCGLILVLLAIGLFLYLKPQVMGRKEIYSGVFLTVEQIHRGSQGNGKAMVVEVHWDTPGVRLAGREYSYPYNPADPDSPHYRLVLADWALWREDAAILVNTAGYTPEQPLRSLPGSPVQAVETVVVNSQPSHVHPHSYLLYWDREWNARLRREKPPDAGSLSEAVLGIGLQGLPVIDGEIRGQALDHKEVVMPRTFIGVDPDRKILFLMAFENASGYWMLEKALQLGVRHGGMLDSGDATHLLVGSGARGVVPHRGIRHWRPLGPYLTVFANPLQP